MSVHEVTGDERLQGQLTGGLSDEGQLQWDQCLVCMHVCVCVCAPLVPLCVRGSSPAAGVQPWGLVCQVPAAGQGKVPGQPLERPHV